MARKTLQERRSEKMAEIERLKAEVAELESKAAERIGKIAVSAGLADMDEAALRKEFDAIAARFRKASGKASAAPSTADAG